MTSYYNNPTSAVPEGIGLERYVDIDASEELSGNVSSIYLTMTYTDEEVIARNINESTLSLYYHNDTLGAWQKVDASFPWVYGSGVDTANNTVWANVSRFETYTISGENLRITFDVPLWEGWTLIALPLEDM